MEAMIFSVAESAGSFRGSVPPGILFSEILFVLVAICALVVWKKWYVQFILALVLVGTIAGGSLGFSLLADGNAAQYIAGAIVLIGSMAIALASAITVKILYFSNHHLSPSAKTLQEKGN